MSDRPAGEKLHGPTLLLVALIAVAVSGTGLFWMHRELAAALALRPPILILDLAGAARAADPAHLPALLEDSRRTAERLAGQGALVLDRQAVLAAPVGLTLTDREVRDAPP